MSGTLPLDDGDVAVWYRFTHSIDDDALPQLVGALSATERERCERFVFARDRRDFAAAHALLRTTLSHYAPAEPAAWRFATNAHGKPSLEPAHATDVTFNLSHAQGLVACAVTRCADVGIDVESVDRIVAGRNVAGHYFSPAEIDALDRTPQDDYQRRFIEIWTLKEAYIKAVGLGLSHPLDTFSFVIAGDTDIRFHPPADAANRNWQFLLARFAAGHRLAVAVERSRAACRITLHDADRQDAARGEPFQVVDFTSAE